MTYSPKPIQTRYKGYRFRSRLEARWAVFFDHLELPWEYEAQGFELPSGRYLPDFWLPTLGCWAEVKPDPDTIDWIKIKELAEATGKDVTLLVGTPAVDWCVHFIPGFEFEDTDGKIGKIGHVFELIDLAASAGCGYPWLNLKKYEPGEPFPGQDRMFQEYLPWFRDAVNAARAARFEFGETPGGGGV